MYSVCHFQGRASLVGLEGDRMTLEGDRWGHWEGLDRSFLLTDSITHTVKKRGKDTLQSWTPQRTV